MRTLLVTNDSRVFLPFLRHPMYAQTSLCAWGDLESKHIPWIFYVCCFSGCPGQSMDQRQRIRRKGNRLNEYDMSLEMQSDGISLFMQVQLLLGFHSGSETIVPQITLNILVSSARVWLPSFLIYYHSCPRQSLKERHCWRSIPFPFSFFYSRKLHMFVYKNGSYFPPVVDSGVCS